MSVLIILYNYFYNVNGIIIIIITFSDGPDVETVTVSNKILPLSFIKGNVIIVFVIIFLEVYCTDNQKI